MELIFLGTSSGRTSLNRYHSSILFKDESNIILIDSGDGVSKALLTLNISFNSITDIVISHYHSDHLAGLPSLLTQMIILKRTKKLRIFTHIKLINRLNEFLRTSYLFSETFKFPLEILGFEHDSQKVVHNNFKFIAKKNSHIRNKHNIDDNTLPFLSSSFLFQAENKNIVYTSDIASTEDLYLFYNKEIDIFIVEATHVPLTKIETALTIFSPNKTFLTHIDNENYLIKWLDSFTELKRKKISIANDGEKIDL